MAKIFIRIRRNIVILIFQIVLINGAPLVHILQVSLLLTGREVACLYQATADSGGGVSLGVEGWLLEQVRCLDVIR